MLRLPCLASATLGCLLALGVSAPTPATQQPQETPLRELQFEHPGLSLHAPFIAASSPWLAPADRDDLERLGVAPDRAFLDSAGDGWGTLLLRRPLIPGRGVGNTLDGSAFGSPTPTSGPELAAIVERAFFDYLRRHARELRLDPSEIVRPLDIEVHRGGELIQVRARRQLVGLPVRNSRITAVIAQGNLVLMGSRNWSPISVDLEPTLTEDEALRRVEAYLEGWTVAGTDTENELIVVPLRSSTPRPPESALLHRLAWAVHPVIEGSRGRWEALVDAHDGEILAFVDRNLHDSTRKVSGGVFPVSNDGELPDGIEQPGWPMPFVFVDTEAGTLTADSSGHLPIEVDGIISTDLTGPFVLIDDTCGEILETSPGDIDLGSGPGTSCEVPPGGSPGNTHSARTTFYELNRAQEVARGQLPANSWLQQQLTAFTNENLTCSAYWEGTAIHLSRGNPPCVAAGEVAGVIDHEWAHGMDQNDANGSISTPAEGIADVYAALRLNTSCIGRGMLPFVCSGYGDPCLTCDGVRDIDWEQRTSGLPHDIGWAAANCPPNSPGGPCGRTDHCEAAVVSEAIWDLYRRALPAPPFLLDANTSLEIATRLTYLGAGAVDAWYTCGGGNEDGCNADGGYLNYLAADDDNGDLSDGTPHMQAIFDAFDAHGIACSVPAVQNSGCPGAPTGAPTVTAVAGDRSAALAWDPVAGAQSYRIFRGEGVFECDFSKVRIGETTELGFVDTEVRNDFEVYYTVAAMGPADTCLGPMSACTPVTPSTVGDLEISVRGSCPGTLRVRVAGATPDARVTLYRSRQPGSFILPGGPCAGTELDLRQPRRWSRRRANAQGIAAFSIPVSNSCGVLVQALDGASCGTSPVIQTP